MTYIDDVRQAAKACASGKEVVFVINKHNKYSLFKFAYYQLKYKTTKEFKHISYQKQKDLLYYFLRICSFVSFKKYILTYDYQ